MRRTESKFVKATRCYKGGGGAKPVPPPLQPRRGDMVQTITQSRERNPARRFRGFGQHILSSGFLGSFTENSILGSK